MQGSAGGARRKSQIGPAVGRREKTQGTIPCLVRRREEILRSCRTVQREWWQRRSLLGQSRKHPSSGQGMERVLECTGVEVVQGWGGGSGGFPSKAGGAEGRNIARGVTCTRGGAHEMHEHATMWKVASDTLAVML
jgi:hypothetical protein